MEEDNKLAIDEERRAAQHESIKLQVEGDVNAERYCCKDYFEARKMDVLQELF